MHLGISFHDPWQLKMHIWSYLTVNLEVLIWPHYSHGAQVLREINSHVLERC